MVLIHYITDKHEFVEILRTGKIMAKQPPNSNLPFGVYLTETPLEPPKRRFGIKNDDELKRVLNDPDLTNRTEYSFIFNSIYFPKAYKQVIGKNEWVIPHNIRWYRPNLWYCAKKLMAKVICGITH